MSYLNLQLFLFLVFFSNNILTYTLFTRPTTNKLTPTKASTSATVKSTSTSVRAKPIIELSCKTISTGITKDLKESVIQNAAVFSVNITDLRSFTIYSGDYVYAILFNYKNGISRQYGDINGNRASLRRKIDLENKKILNYRIGLFNNKINNLQLLIYNLLDNTQMWTPELGLNRKEGFLSVNNTIIWSSFTEYTSFEGSLDPTSLRDWRMQYKQMACIEVTTTTKKTTTTPKRTIITTTRILPTFDMFVCRKPFNVTMIKSKKIGTSFRYTKIYEYTAPSVYYCSCTCGAGEKSEVLFSCTLYDFNIKTRKCILYSLSVSQIDARNYILFLDDNDHISGFNFEEPIRSTITTTEFINTTISTKIDALGVTSVTVGAANTGMFSVGFLAFLFNKFKDKLPDFLKCCKKDEDEEDDEEDDKEEEKEEKEEKTTMKKPTQEDLELLKNQMKNQFKDNSELEEFDNYEDRTKNLLLNNGENVQLLRNGLSSIPFSNNRSRSSRQYDPEGLNTYHQPNHVRFLDSYDM